MSSAHAAPPGAASTRRFIDRASFWRRSEATTDTTPMWSKVGFGAVLLLAAFLCLWDLSRNGNSNTYYAAAVKSASVSWKALFFGSLDPGSFITVDKPPLSIWLMGLSTRVFGFSSFAMLMPQALCTVGAVALLHATVKRVSSPAAAIAAALALALTPITVAIARVNNPDALMILLLVGSAYLLVRALESGKTKFLAWCGVLVGLAFMTKMLQGWMVLPALALTYFAFGPGGLGRRTWQLLVALATTVAVSCAWPVAVTLWPGSKPFIGGSTDGGVWDLILGYNGFGRITGAEGGMGGGGGSFGGTAGWLRMFNDQVGGQIAWLIPLAGVSLIAGLWMTRKAPRTDLRRAGLALFGIWAIVHVAIFSTQQGIFHPYYTSAMAPALAALAGIGVVMLFKAARKSWLALGILDLSVAGTALLAMDLLGRSTDAPGWATIAVPVGAVIAVVLSPALRLMDGKPSLRKVVAIGAVAGTFALLAGPASYSVANLGRSLNGNNVLAGPAGASSGGFGGMGGGGRGGFGGGTGGPPSGGGQMGTPPAGGFGGAAPSGTAGTTSSTTGTTNAAGSTSSTTGSSSTTGTATPSGSTSATATQGGPGGGGGMGGGGGLSDAAIKYLEANQGSAKYLVAATGSQTTASIIIQTGKAVVTMGGFSGSDPAPTVAQLAAMVKSGELKYVLVSSGGMGGRGGSSDITAWVEAHGKAVTSVTTTSGTLYEVTAS
jgi:4-amino-4-deoxy-L-arabinose transferase-like glycosyltransferase